MKILDALGRELKVGDEIAWIHNPSWSKRMVQGTIQKITTVERHYYGRREVPQLVAKAKEDPNYKWDKPERASVLVCCRWTKEQPDVWIFERVVKL